LSLPFPYSLSLFTSLIQKPPFVNDVEIKKRWYNIGQTLSGGVTVAAVVLREIQLTPDDIVQAVRAFGPDELADLRQRLQEHDLLAELTKSGDISKQYIPKTPALDQDAPASDEEIPEFWKLADVEPLPEPPPPTPEGDEIALAALDEICRLPPITNPKLGRWVAESEELAIYNAYLHTEKKYGIGQSETRRK
jgi:hypothetical protein